MTRERILIKHAYNPLPKRAHGELSGDYGFAFTGWIRGLVDDNGKPIKNQSK